MSTIRRTPSPAPRHPSPQPSQGFRQGRVSPAPGERTQLSLDEAVRLMQGHPAASVSGQFLSQLSQQQTRQQEAEDVHRVIIAYLLCKMFLLDNKWSHDINIFKI